MEVEIIDIVLFVLFFQLLTLTPYLLVQKNLQGHANKILALFLLAKALCITNFIAYRLFDTTYTYFPHAFNFGSSFTILWGPLLYFYVKSCTIRNYKFKRIDIIHFIPFLVHFTYLTVSFHIHNADTKRYIISEGALFSTMLNQLITAFTHLSILCYTIASFVLVKKYNTRIKDQFSSIDTINLSWLFFILVGFSLKWSFDIWFIAETNFTEINGFIPLVLSRISLFLFLNILVYKALKTPVIFTGVAEPLLIPEKKSLSDAVLKKYKSILLNYMRDNKPYMNPDLTLNDLASKVSIAPRSLSEVINNSFGQNFYDFVNSYRIKESQQLLADSTSNMTTILEVLYEVGFNSKSSFNNAFKKNTGMTPSQYKRTIAVYA